MGIARRIIHTLLARSPRQNAWVFRRELNRMLGDAGYSIADLHLAPKFLSPVAEIDRFERYLRVLSLHGENLTVAPFRDSVVVEIGCGPVLGIGPQAVFRGARRVYFLEPAMNRRLLEADPVIEEYFRPMHAELCAEYEPASDEYLEFDQFHGIILERCSDLGKRDPDDGIDFVYSNSVLEHIQPDDLGKVLARLASLCVDGAQFLHAVDFSDHRKGSLPFEGIYRSNPPEGRMVGGINRLRASEIQRALERAGFRGKKVPYRKYDGDLGPLAEHWQGFSRDDLVTRVAFFVGEVGEQPTSR